MLVQPAFQQALQRAISERDFNVKLLDLLLDHGCSLSGCSLSEQEVADCTNKGKDTCDLGGEMHDGVMEVVTQLGGKVAVERAYPCAGRSKVAPARSNDSVP